ncbi:1-phosphofructokinase [Clostridium grantii]|uniref:Tagatose-6-phosphate kinase n=1 Tax=Clostridium grantii DSM 8605 TaxID=1121316 RepID=A0A1M5SAJ3_9CLOT|nr:1-phosphofructokinase [Clostridium grantii]SHH35607.1 1-phosphofructokinase [Clostridium grantii DSM 8605]
MITTVTLNPAIDRTVIVDKLNNGAVNRVKSVREDIGGKGINVTKVLNSLGSTSTAIGFMGKKNYEETNALFKEVNIETAFKMVDAKTRLNIKVVESSNNETTDINESGFEVSNKEIEEVIDLIKEFAIKSEFVVLSGSIPKGMDENTYYEIISQINDKTKTVLDADGALLLKGLKAKPYLIKPNIHELENALKVSLESHESIVKASKQLIEDFGITYVLVSMGGDGSILVGKEEAYFAESLKVEVKGTVGAGDSMLAGFLHGLIENENALAYATACGALAVSLEGTQTFSKKDVISLLEKVKINLLKF